VKEKSRFAASSGFLVLIYQHSGLFDLGHFFR
jgi:hypothetical protein